MKQFILYTIILIMIGGCSKILEISPNDVISGDKVEKDPVLLDAYLSNVYHATRWQTQGADQTSGGPATISVCGGEHNVFAAWQGPNGAAFKPIDEKGAHSWLEYWSYTNIRSANEIIQILAESSEFEEDFVTLRTAEARFLRAFMYFEMVKRYGGVPLLTEPQSIESTEEELYVKRNSEKEIYDFIETEMDAVFEILPNSHPDEFGRATKWAAMALKSRAMLYAGSIAKYGKVQLDGLLGIPNGEANSYYDKAYKAAMKVIDESPHQLYKKETDPAENFQKIFTDEKNTEIILAEVYDFGLKKTHSWNRYSMPDGFVSGWGANFPVYLETVEWFEYMDGSSGKLDYSELDGSVLFDIETLMHQKDPRFRASIFYPEAPWQGGEVYFHSETKDFPEEPDERMGWEEKSPRRNNIRSGFNVRKRVDEDIKLPDLDTDETDWIIFRLGEMYLNAAEAKFEMEGAGSGDGSAISLINTIRDRAGMPDKTSLTLDEVRNERAVELAFEEHRYWDLRRWRIAEEVLHDKGFSGVKWTYHFNEKKYSIKKQSGEYKNKRTFEAHHYYFPMGTNRRADNPNLTENPGYITE